MTDQLRGDVPSSEPDATAEVSAVASTASARSFPGWRPVASVSAVVALAISQVSILAYDRFVKAAPRSVATISLQDVLEAKQAQFAEAVSRPGVTDADRSRALDSVESIAPQMAKAVQELTQSCNCIVLVKEAVVGRADLDLTPQLLEKMGAGNIDLAALRSRLLASPSAEQKAGK